MSGEKINPRDAAENLSKREHSSASKGTVVPGGLVKEESLHGGQVTEHTIEKKKFESSVHSAADKGWKNVPLENLPTQGLLYPAGVEITICAASVDEIRHWSTIDESDMIDMDKRLNFIIERCVRVNNKNNAGGSWKDIVEVDRFYLAFLIHELTFPNGENKLYVKIMCDNENCLRDPGYKPTKAHVRSNMLNVFNVPEELMKFYDPGKRCFTIPCKANGQKYDFYLPITGVASRVKEYAVTKQQKGEPFDQAFGKVMPFLYNTWRGLNDDKIDEMRIKSMKWTKDEVLFFNKVVDILIDAMPLEVVDVCDRCQEETRVPLFFRDGFTIKDLFAPRELDGLIG